MGTEGHPPVAPLDLVGGRPCRKPEGLQPHEMDQSFDWDPRGGGNGENAVFLTDRQNEKNEG